MTTGDNVPQAGNKYWLPVALGLALVGVVVYFPVLHPPVQNQEAGGTIAGAQKADKYQSQQFGEQDVVLQDTELQAHPAKRPGPEADPG